MVLNEAAARLGVSLRQTEDELTRNMLAGTAAFINCVGGVNGDNPTEKEFKDLMESLKEKRDILKVSASDGELDFSSMQEVAHTTYSSAF